MKVKLILALPTTIDADNFMAFIKNQAVGRYNDKRIAEYWLPSLELCGYRGYLKGAENHSCAIYECNAADLIPPFISVIHSLKNFGMLNYYFTFNGQSVHLDWRNSDFEAYFYDFDAIDDATELWLNQIAQLEGAVNKSA